VLEDEGFQVVDVATATEALLQSEKELLEYSAVIIDLGLPDLPGDKVARRFRAMRMDLPIIICSGRSEGELQELVPSEGRRLEHLAKPFTAAFLVDALNRLGIASPISRSNPNCS
jgi:DNA-binding response OmpR family regulator